MPEDYLGWHTEASTRLLEGWGTSRCRICKKWAIWRAPSLPKIRNTIADRCHLSSFWVRRARGGIVRINLIAVEPARRGHGLFRVAMERLIVWAQVTGVTLELSPSALYGADLPRLRRAYEALGFSGDSVMRRLP